MNAESHQPKQQTTNSPAESVPSGDGGGGTHRPLLPEWANNQDGWVRTIVRDVLRDGIETSDSDIDRYLKVLFSEKKLSSDPYEPVPEIEARQRDLNPLASVRLTSLTVDDGVNALKPGAEIEFAPRVTIIFGENGSGKSGFVRVLKRAAGVRTAEEILPDVHADRHPTPTGSFSVRVGGTSQTIAWNNDFGVAPLNRISIFDARGARLHVEDDLAYVYTPGELALFPLVQNAIEQVRSALGSAISARRPAGNLLLASFDRSSSIYAAIETLGAATDLAEVRAFATVPEDIDARIESLGIEIDALSSSRKRSELKRARNRAALVQDLGRAIDLMAAFDEAEYASLVATRDAAARQRDAAGGKAFEDLAIPGILGPEWRRFIQAGEEYLTANAPADYPLENSTCAYCRQPLTTAALQLLKKYRNFSNNDIKHALDEAERQLRQYVSTTEEIDIEGLSQRLHTEINDQPDVLAPIIPILGQIRELIDGLASGTVTSWKDRAAELAEAKRLASGESIRLDDLIGQLQDSADKREGALEAKRAELTELKAKKTTHTLLPQIEKRVRDAKWVARATIVKNNITGILRSLTESAKEASEELLNKDFAKRFEDECQRLRAPSVTLNFPGREGQVTRRKLVASYKPTQILSEGEQKALALADFLAEVTSIPASSPVVFDDPITSMDYRRIHEVCDRIVALSEEHQMVVFTHNIWFAAELLSKADKKEWQYYDIRAEGGEVGVVTAASHPRVDSLRQVRGSINQLIQAAGSQEGEVRAALVEKGYEHLRSLCEIVVEHELLQGVVTRYAPNVMMTKLDKINAEKLQESVASIVPVYEKSCRYIASHSQPLETQGIRPKLDELKKDLETVLDARDPHK